MTAMCLSSKQILGPSIKSLGASRSFMSSDPLADHDEAFISYLDSCALSDICMTKQPDQSVRMLGNRMSTLYAKSSSNSNCRWRSEYIRFTPASGFLKDKHKKEAKFDLGKLSNPHSELSSHCVSHCAVCCLREQRIS